MTQPEAKDICHIIAEQIWNSKGAYFQGWDREVFVDDIAEALRNHTIVPEMVRMLEVVEYKSSDAILVAHIKELLTKAGRKP